MLEKKPSSAPNTLFPPLSVTAISLILLIGAVILSVALFSYNSADPAWRHNGDGETTNSLGVIGAWYSDLSFSLIGQLSYLLPLALLAMCVNVWLEKKFDKELLSWRLIMLLSAILSGCVLWAKHDPVVINTVAQTGGGALGAWLTIGLEKSVKSVSIIMAFSAVIFVISISLLLNIPWFKLMDSIGKGIVALFAALFSSRGKRAATTTPAEVTENSLENTALQNKIKDLNKKVEQHRQEKSLDEETLGNLPPRPHFTIDRYEPENNADNTYTTTAPRFINDTTKAEPATHFAQTTQPDTPSSVDEWLHLHTANTPTHARNVETNAADKAEPSFFDFVAMTPSKAPQQTADTVAHTTTGDNPPQATQPVSAQPSFSASNTAATLGLATGGIAAAQQAFPSNEAPTEAPFFANTHQQDDIPTAIATEADTLTSPSLADTFSTGGTQSLLQTEAFNEPVPTPIEPSETLKRALSETTPVAPSLVEATPELVDSTPIPEAKPRPLTIPNTHQDSVTELPEITPVATPNTDTEIPQPVLQQPAYASPTPEPTYHEPVQQAPTQHATSEAIAPATATAAVAATTATIGKAYENTNETVVDSEINGPYELPSVQLLDSPPPQTNAYTEDALAEMAGVLEATLKQFNINAIVMHVSPGPVITRFELELAPGIQAKKITNLSQDLARALAVSRVRVEEVIPGSSYVGLEVPNKQRQIVYFKDVVHSKAFQDSASPLTLSLGSDTSGKPVVADLMKMPHALVAGTTGSGKSVCINVMLLSMLYKASPKDLRLILVDPKMLEMSMYEDIPHLLTPVITDMNEAENALTWAVGEMERRYQLMAALKVRKIDAFNEQIDAANARGEPIKDPLWEPDESVGYTHHPSLERLPFIVIVIDELADMMMVVGKQVEQLIARLTQKARAAGIHVVLATQRPSTDVLTGLIKANVPTRIAFQVSSGTDSRVIIDSVGAEKLLGHGDMLYVPPGVSHPQRLHGAFVGDAETDRITDYLRSTAEPDYINGITGKQAPETLGAFGAAEAAESKEDADPLYEEAVNIVLQTGKASISSVQRQLRIGYNRAARMIEDMQEQGIVSEPVNGIRKVLGAPKPKTDV